MTGPFEESLPSFSPIRAPLLPPRPALSLIHAKLLLARCEDHPSYLHPSTPSSPQWRPTPPSSPGWPFTPAPRSLCSSQCSHGPDHPRIRSIFLRHVCRTPYLQVQLWWVPVPGGSCQPTEYRQGNDSRILIVTSIANIAALYPSDTDKVLVCQNGNIMKYFRDKLRGEVLRGVHQNVDYNYFYHSVYIYNHWILLHLHKFLMKSTISP